MFLDFYDVAKFGHATCLAFYTNSKNKKEVVPSLVEGFYNANIRVQGYTKMHMSLKHIAINLIIKYEICIEK